MKPDQKRAPPARERTDPQLPVETFANFTQAIAELLAQRRTNQTPAVKQNGMWNREPQ